MSQGGSSESTPQERYKQLIELSPSAKYVYTILERSGTLTQDELAERTLLPKRTVQYALDRLDQDGLLEKHVDASDARCRRYSSTPVEHPDENDTGQ